MGDARSLRREEALERSRLLRVDRYDIDVDLTGLLDGPEWRATSTVTFGCTTPGASTFVDCAASVSAATLNGVDISADRIGDGRIQLDDLGTENVLVVASEQTDTGSQQGVQRCVDPSDKEVYVWTSFEPDDARMCWACFDQPDLKAPHAFSVLAPEAWTVTSNRPVDTVTAESGGRRWVFPDTPRLSTYVVVVNAGPFYALRSTRAGYDLGMFCRRSLAPFLDRDAEELFGLTAAGLTFFGDRFGQPFGQGKYDTVFIPDMPGAMENWGCVTWGDFSLYRTPPTRRDRALRAEILLHEMAHMWFGDLVTMQWWDDLWLNEAFATWASLWASAEATEFTAAWATFLTLDKSTGYVADRAVTAHPIRQPAGDVAEATASFDAITYVKGASVLKQLVALVGPDRFTAALREYFAQHAWGNTSLADLMGAVAKASGRDLDDWTSNWLDRTGTDRIELRRSGDDWVLEVTSPDNARPRPHRLDIGVYARGENGSLRRTALVPVETKGHSTVVGPLPAADLRLVNDEDLTFASSRLDPGSRAELLSGAADLPTSTARAVAVTTAWDMLAYAEISTAEFVRCAAGAVRAETDAGVANDLLRMLRVAAEQWSPARDRDALLSKVAEVASGLVDQPDLRDTALRTVARSALTDRHIDLLREHVGDDTDLHWTLLVRLAELGRLDQEEADALEARDPDPDVEIRTLEVRAARPERKAKEAVWRAVFVDRAVPADRIIDLAAAFWRPGQEDLLREYTRRYLETVTGLQGGMMLVAVLSRGFFPSAVGDAEFLAAAQKTADTEGLNPALRQALLERSDILRRMLRAREA
ncbi:MAG: aminopeptidase N [Nocardioidaceae bacterium]